MAWNWYYALGNEKKGPVDEEKIKELIREGVITADTLVWSEKMLDWDKASKTELAKYGLTDIPIPMKAFAPPELFPDQLQDECSLCGNGFPPADLVEIEGSKVCAECKPKMLRKIQEGNFSSGEFRYGGFWIRFAAKFIDGLILMLIGLPLTIIGVIIPPMVKGSANETIIVLAFTLLNWTLSIGLGMLYCAWFLVKKNATPGKMALGLKVINADGTGKISVGKAIGRYFACDWLSGMLTLFIGYIMAGFDAEKRALHDRICNTRVVYKE